MATREAPVAPPPSEDVRDLARVELAACLRAAASHGYNEGIDNHFSLAVPGRADRFLLNRFGPHWSEMRASDLLEIDAGGTVVAGEGRWDVTAFMIHRAVHMAQPAARCVLHTHMPFTTALACTEAGLDTRLSQNAAAFHGRVARLGYGGLADEAAEGERIGAAVADGIWAVLLDNHGALVVAETVAEAWFRLYFLERSCQFQVLAASTGSPLVRMDEATAQHTAAQWANSAGAAADLFAAVRRVLDRDDPSYRD